MLTDIGWKIDEESLKHKNKVFQASKYLLDYVPKASGFNDIIGKNSDKEFKKVLENLNKDPSIVEETDKALDNLVPNNQDFEGVEAILNEIRQNELIENEIRNEIRRLEENRERAPGNGDRILLNVNNPLNVQNIRPEAEPGLLALVEGAGVRVDWGQNFNDIERLILNRAAVEDPNPNNR